jgi:hypothetical protein
MRTFIAAIVGIVSAGIAIWIFEFLGHLMFPVKLNFNPKNPEELKLIMYSIPFKSMVAVIVAHVLGILVGLIIAYKIDKTTKAHLFGVSGILLLFSVVNLIAIPHPTWFLIADIMGVVLVSALFIGTRKKA